MAKATDYRAMTRAILEKTGENQQQFAERVGVSQASVSRWASGKPPELHHAELLTSEARRLRIAHPKLGSGQVSVPVIGYVGAGGTIDFTSGQGPFGEAEMPPKGAVPSLVAVLVKGDSMSGVLEDGWTVYYDNRKEPPDENMHGKLCIVGLKDGPTLIKKLYPGRKPFHFDLHSVNAPALLDQHVEWAARITWIAPK